eukprot:Hpha_TRINITY_DN16821_c1_g7::TRINITY_DN16821_c1_g7_i1::g.153774::m.153774
MFPAMQSLAHLSSDVDGPFFERRHCRVCRLQPRGGRASGKAEGRRGPTLCRRCSSFVRRRCLGTQLHGRGATPHGTQVGCDETRRCVVAGGANRADKGLRKTGTRGCGSWDRHWVAKSNRRGPRRRGHTLRRRALALGLPRARRARGRTRGRHLGPLGCHGRLLAVGGSGLEPEDNAAQTLDLLLVFGSLCIHLSLRLPLLFQGRSELRLLAAHLLEFFTHSFQLASAALNFYLPLLQHRHNEAVFRHAPLRSTPLKRVALAVLCGFRAELRKLRRDRLELLLLLSQTLLQVAPRLRLGLDAFVALLPPGVPLLPLPRDNAMQLACLLLLLGELSLQLCDGLTGLRQLRLRSRQLPLQLLNPVVLPLRCDITETLVVLLEGLDPLFPLALLLGKNTDYVVEIPLPLHESGLFGLTAAGQFLVLTAGLLQLRSLFVAGRQRVFPLLRSYTQLLLQLLHELELLVTLHTQVVVGFPEGGIVRGRGAVALRWGRRGDSAVTGNRHGTSLRVLHSLFIPFSP